MTSLIAGTWSLISSSAEVITGARRMTVRIQRLLQLEKVEISESDRRRLLGLEKRVACLVQPLNFLLLWSKNRDSCVQQAVLSAQGLLFDVCSYVERFVPQDYSPLSTGGKGANDCANVGLDSEKLEYYLRELEFACASVSMAVSIARAIDAPPLQHVPIQDAGSNNNNDNSVSLSALLRASRRIQEMRGRTGDLCTCPGRLYSEAVGFRSVPSTAAAASQPPQPGSNGSLAAEAGADEQEEWAPVLSLATFKVVAQEDSRRGRRRYRITVDSRLPLTQRESSPPPRSHDMGDEEIQRGLNAAGPLTFPIEVALDARLVTTASMSFPSEPSRYLHDLGIDSLVLVWGSVPSASDASYLVETYSSEFPDAVLLPEAMPSHEADATSRPQLPRWTSLSAGATPRPAAPTPGRFAFVFDSRGTAEPRAGEAEVALTPLDALYLARLCALDDGQVAAVQDGADTGVGSTAPHLLSSDEVLSTLLQEGYPSRSINSDSVKPGMENGHGPCGMAGGATTAAAQNGTS